MTYTGDFPMIPYDYYKIFYYVAQYKSFTKAARVLNNNQPNVTRCMNNLEQELKCTLFLRSNKGIVLTPEGRQLYEHVSIACEQLAVGEAEIRQNGELENGLVTIGASENALRLILLEKLEAFRQVYPHVRLRLFNHSTPQAVQALKNYTADFAVVTSPVSIHKPLQKTTLLKYHDVLICGSKYKELALRPRSLKDLMNIPMVSLGENTGTRELYMNYFMEQHLNFQPDIEAATTDQVLPMIVHNLGIGFYPESLAEEVIRNGKICSIPLLEPLPEREVCLITNGSTAMSAAVKKVIKFIE